MLLVAFSEIKMGHFKNAAAICKKIICLPCSPSDDSKIIFKAKFYFVVANSLLEKNSYYRVASPKLKKLLIAGLGSSPPYTATLDSIRLANSCDLAFNNLSEPEIAYLLAILARGTIPTMFDARGADRRWTRTIFSQVKPGSTVGFITRGHPQVCGGLAASLLKECVRTNVDSKLLPAVSSMDVLTMRFSGQSSLWGQQVLDWSSVFDEKFTLDIRLTAVLYFNAAVQLVTSKKYAEFCKRLIALYGSDHFVQFYGRTFSALPEKIALAEISSWYGRIDSSYTLVLPPKSKNE